jgi:nucleotide-binding universal stress UspA family protein
MEANRRARQKKRIPRIGVTPYIVLVGLDLSEPGGRAWRFAFELAALHGEGSEVHAVVVGARSHEPEVRDVETPETNDTSEEVTGPVSQPRLKVLEHRSVKGRPRLMAMHFRSGRVDRAIVDLAKEIGADMIVIASEPPTAIERWLGSSVAERVTRDAPCPVAVVRQKRVESATDLSA